MAINSKRKGAKGEIELAHKLEEYGEFTEVDGDEDLPF